MPEVLTTTSVAHVALYERLRNERAELARPLADDAKRRPDAPASAVVLVQLSRMIQGARRITARMPGGARLPFRPIAAASNAEALALAGQVGTALLAFKDCYQEWDENAGEEDELGPTGDFVWNTLDGY